jgi:enoyl-CoA hydratase/carnithine racemase
MEIALACDIRIAAENAQLGQPEVSAGTMTAWGGSQRLPRMIPWCKAAEMLFTGQRVDALEAYRIGLVNKVVPRDQLIEEAKKMAEAICLAGPLAVRSTKEAMIRGSNMALEEGLQLEKELATKVKSSEDFQEGAKAFAEKRRPEWKGR